MERKKILWLFFLSFALRAAFVLTLPASLRFDDEFEYWRMVQNFLSGQGLMVSQHWKAFRPPLYPFFLSIFVFLQANFLAIRIVQAIISAATVVLIFFLGEKLFSKKVGWLAGILSAVYPFFIFYSGFLLTETLFIFLTVWTILELITMHNKPTYMAAVRAGFSLGLSSLCRPTMLVFAPFGLLLNFMNAADKRLRAKEIFVSLVVLLVTISPWVTRNYVLLKKFVPGTTMGGWVFWEGNNPHSEGGPCRIFPEEVSKIPEGERDRFLYRETWKVIRNNPRRYLWLLQNKFRRFWNIVPNAQEFSKPSYCLISVLSFGLILPFFLIGFVLSWKTQSVRHLHALIIFFTLFHMVYLASIRYRVAIEPMVLILGAHGWFSIISLISGTNWPIKKHRNHQNY
ncbi:MAG: glycosyltransferase family 39 protein [Candidatus Omnitrophica bacterium]|nr:glycosyltransferase family 39 protein [Candidatus Omnitrophota bacterium]